MMSLRPVTILMMLCLWLAGCAQQPSPAQPTANQPIETEIPADQTAEETLQTYPSAAMNRFIETLYQVLKDKDEAGYLALWDVEAHRLNTLEQITLPPLFTAKDLGNLISTERIQQVIQQQFRQIGGATPYIVQSDINTAKVTLRVTVNDEIIYLTFDLRPQDNEYKIHDLSLNNFGLKQSTRVAYVLGKLVSPVRSERQIADNMIQAVLKLNQPDQAMAYFNRIPKQNLYDLPVFALYYYTASHISEEVFYDYMEGLAQRFHADPNLAYLLVDYYRHKNLTDLEMAAWHRARAAIGPDPELEFMIGDRYLSLGQIDKALQHANNAVRLDSNYDNAYWLLAQVFTQKQEWEAAVEALQVLQLYFGYEFEHEHFATRESFAPLLNQPAYQNWISSLKQG